MSFPSLSDHTLSLLKRYEVSEDSHQSWVWGNDYERNGENSRNINLSILHIHLPNGRVAIYSNEDWSDDNKKWVPEYKITVSEEFASIHSESYNNGCKLCSSYKKSDNRKKLY